ncbi:MAG TPA: metalloregulator ArsR/SmtB family transcription factor [Trebonia sp.]|jgi:DNA-binding transcriptional ArsR family regulator|nr:metalloregulator ArsR/SmtB family transcription factor [Trebonia sp.]
MEQPAAARGGGPDPAGGASAAEDATPTDVVLKAIAEPRRREILRLVARDEMAAGEIAAEFDVTRTAVSQHLAVLRNAGLVSERRAGTRRLYRARPQGLAGLREFLDVMWSSSLDIAVALAEGHVAGERPEGSAAARTRDADDGKIGDTVEATG